MNVVNLIQEEPSHNLTGAPAQVYEAAKRRIAAWNPIPPKKEDDDDDRPRRR